MNIKVWIIESWVLFLSELHVELSDITKKE